jgi:lysophospholipase L1-like esterase
MWVGLTIFGVLLTATPPLAPSQQTADTSAVALHDPSGTAMDGFHTALGRTERGVGVTRIMQFGASHTAADILTSYLRDDLQSQYGDAGIGWFMPARPWRTHRHSRIKHDNPRSKRGRWEWDAVRHSKSFRADGKYGLAGMATTATEKRQWTVWETRHRAKASRLELYVDKLPKGGDFYLQIDSQRRKRYRTRGKGLATIVRTFKDGPHRFRLVPRGNGPVRLYGGVLERDTPGIVFDTLGINGARAVSMLKWDYKLWETLMKKRRPNLVILAYGTNEAGDRDEPIEVYQANLRKVLKRVRNAAPKASCVLFGPTDRPILEDRANKKNKKNVDKTFHVRPRVSLVNESQKRISAEFGCAYFDAIEATGGQFSIVSWADQEPRLAYGDYVHFTNRGYRVLANKFLSALLKGTTTTTKDKRLKSGTL